MIKRQDIKKIVAITTLFFLTIRIAYGHTVYHHPNKLKCFSMELCDLPLERVAEAQKKIKYIWGDRKAELSEQALILAYIKPGYFVLELGTNVGLSTLMAASQLQDSSHLVTSESNPKTAEKALENRDANHFNYAIVPAISKNKIIQKEGEWEARKPEDWEARILDPDENVPEGWRLVPTVDLATIKRDYKINKFDMLIIDCEGCANHVLTENPELLENVKTIIFEHDERSQESYNEMVNLLGYYNFERKVCIHAPYEQIFNRKTDCFHAVYTKKTISVM